MKKIVEKIRDIFLFNKRGKYRSKLYGFSKIDLKLSTSELLYTKPVLFFFLVAIFFVIILLVIDIFFINLNSDNWQTNLLINLHASVIEVFILGIIVAWYNKQSNRLERIRLLQEELHSNRLLESEEAVYKKVGILKSLSRLNAKGIDIAGSNLEMEYGVYLDNIKLPKAILDGTRLTKVNLRGADLRFSNLTHTQLHGAEMSNSNLQGAGLLFTNLIGADLYNVNLKNAQIEAIMIDKTTSFKGVHLEGAKVEDEYWFDKLKSIGVKGYEDIIKKYHIVKVKEKWYGHIQYNYRIKI